jgi:uncharacterized MAPEG superfamily protein
MKPELTYLLFSVVLTFAQVLIAAMAANQVVGLTALAGNREDLPVMLKGFAGRAKRAHLNMLENLVLFSALVLIAVVANKTNATTALGAMIFFWARLAYAAIYLIGIPWLRTLAWFVSVIGMIMVAIPLF